MLLSAPILSCVPGRNKIDCNAPFTFAPADLDPSTASVSARNFALAGAVLLLGDERRKLVGCQGDADVIFHLVADSAGTVVAKEHSDLLCLRSIDVQRAAQTALEEAWRKSQSAAANEDPAPVPSKATIMSFLTFLAHWTAKWVHHTFHFEQTFQHERGVNIHGTLLPVLKEMIGMAAAMCLRSSAAEAHNQQLHKSKTREVSEQEDASLSEAMASRVLDARSSALTVWAFNTGGSLRFIGSSLELPQALKELWTSLKRMQQRIPERMQQRIPEPPTDLSACSQESLRDLLLQVMSGHGFTTEEECRCSAFAIAGLWGGPVTTVGNICCKIQWPVTSQRACLPCCQSCFVLPVRDLKLGSTSHHITPHHITSHSHHIAFTQEHTPEYRVAGVERCIPWFRAHPWQHGEACWCCGAPPRRTVLHPYGWSWLRENGASNANSVTCHRSSCDLFFFWLVFVNTKEVGRTAPNSARLVIGSVCVAL